jgi:hypothetical protein
MNDMKAIKKIDAMVELANNLASEPAPFDAVSHAHFLAIELCGYHKAHDRVTALELEIENTRATRNERKTNIDKNLVEMFNNNVTMIRGAGVTKCPIRIELTKTLDKEGIAEKTRNNILLAISYSLHKKKLYNIHWADDVKAEREAIIKHLESEYLTECITRKQTKGDAGVDAYFIAMNTNLNEKAIIEQWDDKEKKFWVDAHKKIQADTLEKIKTVAQNSDTPPASEPPASEPPASEPPASEPPASEPPASEPPASEPPASEPPVYNRKQYINDTRKIMDTLVGATQVKRALQNSDKPYYDAILKSINDIYGTLKLMTLDKDISKIIGDMQENDDYDDDNLDIDSELVD